MILLYIWLHSFQDLIFLMWALKLVGDNLFLLEIHQLFTCLLELGKFASPKVRIALKSSHWMYLQLLSFTITGIIIIFRKLIWGENGQFFLQLCSCYFFKILYYLFYFLSNCVEGPNWSRIILFWLLKFYWSYKFRVNEISRL